MVGFEVDGPPGDQHNNSFEKVGSEVNDGNVFEKSNIGISDSVIKKYGILRSNIEVYKAKNGGHKIIYLKNSHKNIMKLIKQSLGEAKPQLVIENKGSSLKHSKIYSYEYDGPTGDEDSIKSFATVGVVHKGSPAYVGGLREDDKVIKFGSVDASNFTDILQLQNVVVDSFGKPLNIQVRRGHEILDLTVVPQHWEKSGCFGCQLKKQWCIVKITT